MKRWFSAFIYQKVRSHHPCPHKQNRKTNKNKYQHFSRIDDINEVTQQTAHHKCEETEFRESQISVTFMIKKPLEPINWKEHLNSNFDNC